MTAVATATAFATLAAGAFSWVAPTALADTSTLPTSPASTTPSIVQNGCLADPAMDNSGAGLEYLPAGSTKIVGWAVGNGGAQMMVTAGQQPSPGCQSSIELAYSKGGSITQNVATKPGVVYLLQWYVGSDVENENGGGDTVYVSWNGAVVATETPPDDNQDSMGWTQYQALVTATSAKSLVSFASRNTANAASSVGSVSLSLAPTVNGFAATGLTGPYGTAEKQMLEKTPAHVVLKVSGTPVCALQAVSATQAKGATGLQVVWTVAPTSQFIHETTTATNIAELLGTARWSSIVPSIVDVAEHDPVFADIHSRLQHSHAAPLRTALDRAARRGEIPSTADRDAIAATLLGPLFYRRWFSREPIDAKFLDMVIRTTVEGLRQDTRHQKREQSRR